MKSVHPSHADAFVLEALEPRLLLSGDGLAVDPAIGAGDYPGGDYYAETAGFETGAEGRESESDLFNSQEEVEEADIRFWARSENPGGNNDPSLSSFEFEPANGKALNATLKVDGDDLVLTDNNDQSVLKRQELKATSTILISGSPLNDQLTLNKNASSAWLSMVTFNAGAQLADGKDQLKIIGHGTVEAEYLPSKSAGSGKVNLTHITSSTPDEVVFSGVEELSIEELSYLSIVTPLSADRITLESPAAGVSRISGTSDGNPLIPLTFSKVEGLLVDLSVNDKEPTTGQKIINEIPGVSKVLGGPSSPVDQVTVNGAANGVLTAAGLKSVSILTGKGNDSVFINGSNFSLPVSGGTFGVSGGEGTDTVFAEDAVNRGNVDGSGNGFFGTGAVKISIGSIENLRDIPNRPVVVVPDFFGSFANNSNIGAWFAQAGLKPDQLTTHPINEDYTSVVASLEANGYQMGVSLFVALWDWRLPLAPFDGTMNGVIGGVTGTSISDDVFAHGLDYFGYALKQANDGWAAVHGGVKPESVDTVGFGAGGLLARAYLQSPAHNAPAAGGGLLPKINRLTLVATPHRGQVETWNLLQDDWAASLDMRIVALSLNMSYERLLAEGTIAKPNGGLITRADITVDGTPLGQPSPEKFIATYLPGLRDLLPTFAFIDDGSGTLKSINGDPLLRNNFLLDLNDGLDLSYGVDAFAPNRDPNRYVGNVVDKVTVIYADSGATQTSVQLKNGPPGTIATFTQVEGRTPEAEEIWYKDVRTDGTGDRLVLAASAIGQFDQDSRFGLKILVKKVTEFDTGTGATHFQLFGNATALKHILEGVGRPAPASDIISKGSPNFFEKMFRVVKIGALSLIQEAQAGQSASGGTAAVSIFQSLLGRLATFIGDQFDTSPDDGEATQNIIEFESLTIGLIPIPIKKVLRIDGTSLEFRNFSYNKTTKKFSGQVGLGADVAVLFPGNNTFRVTGTYIDGLVEFKESQFVGFTLKIGELRAQFKDLISVGGREITLSPFAPTVFSAGELFGGIPRLNLEGKVLGLSITNQGEFFVTGFEVTSTTGIFHSLGLGKFLPLDLTGLKVKFLGDANNNGFHDPGETFELTAFDITVTGRLSVEFWDAFPFTPVVQVGPQNAGAPGDEITLTITYNNGEITPKDIGPVTLGFKDLKIGQVTLASTITLGGYQNGVFIPDFGGFLKIESGLQNLTGAFQAEIRGDFSPDLGKLDVSGKLTVGFNLKNGLIKVDNAVLDFGMVIERIIEEDGGFRFAVSPPQGQGFFLKKLQIALLQIKLGNFLTFQSRNTTLDFNAAGSDPLVQFGGTPATQSPENTFDPNSIPNGSLGAVFGDAAGPAKGWGGAVGNFAIGADLSLRILEGFFVQIKVGPSASFGLPKFIPVELRSVTLQFNDAAVENGVLVDPSKFTLIFSGGVKETNNWPLVGQFSGLRVNVEKLIAGDIAGTIENLSGFAIGLNNVKVGPFKVSGSLALGIVNVSVPNEQGVVEERSAFYGRIGGKAYYSGIGGGIDIIISQNGPILATMSLAGLVIPKIGFVFGFRDVGIVFGGDPLPSVEDPMELLENPVFHSPTAITLAEIEKRVQSSLIKGGATWDSAVTLTGTGTVTNIYVQGMITGEATIAANLGFAGADAGLKFLISGNINVLGFEIGGGAMLLDLSDPLVPQLDMAFALPSPSNPIGFLFPAQATLVASLDTEGIIEMPLVGMGVFFEKLANHALATGQELFEQVLAELAAEHEADHALPLSQLLLDLDRDEVVSDQENGRIITTQFIFDRILGNPGNGTPGILLTGFDELLALSPLEYPARIQRAELLIQELVPALIFTARDVANEALPEILAGLAPVIAEAAIEGLAAGWEKFNPTFTLRGLIQPVIFGIPLGPPNADVTITINKDQISFGFTGNLSNFIPIPILRDLPPGILGDTTQFAVTLDLPDELLAAFIKNLANNGAGDLVNLPQYLLENINPFSGWEILFSTTMNVLGFKMGTISGIVFGPQPMNSEGEFEPKGLFGDYVINLDPDGDSIPNEDLLDNIANGPANTIPVNRLDQYQNMLKLGGIALTGQLFIPDMLRDPIETIGSIDWDLPEVSFDLSSPFSDIDKLSDDVSAITKYVNGIFDGLTQQSEWARLQMYLPSPAFLFNVGDYLNPATQGTIEPLDLSSISEVLQSKIDTLLNAFFIEGYSELELMSIGLGSSLIQGDIDSFTISTEIPWLAGLESQFDLKYKTTRITDFLYDLATAPVARLGMLALGIDDPAAAFAFLKHDALSGLPAIELPVSVLEGTFTPEKLGEWLVQNFKIPAPAIRAAQDAGAYHVFFGAYSPGFGDEGDSLIKRQGGFALDTRLDIPGIVDNAQFHFEIAPFSFPAGTDLASFFIPIFSARASVPSLTLPGFLPGSQLLRVHDFLFELERDSDGLSLETHGTLTLLNSAVFSVDGELQVAANGLFGELTVVADGGANFNLPDSGVRFSGVAILRVNTTSSEQLGIAGNSSRIFLTGDLALTLGGVEAFAFDGGFELAVTGDSLEVAFDALLMGGPLGNRGVAGQLYLSFNGIYGGLQVGPWTVEVPNAAFEGEFQLEVNTTGSTRSINAFEVDRATGQVTELRQVGVEPNSIRLVMGGAMTFFDLSMRGWFSFSLNESELLIESDASLTLVAGGATLFGFRTRGGLKLDAGGFAGALELELTDNSAADFGFEFTPFQSDGLRLVETGGAMREGNLARQAAAFAENVIDNGTNPSHKMGHLNDGVYGNGNSWIGATGTSFAGVAFSQSRWIDGVAFGRDNSGTYPDRNAGNYIVQYTTVPNPGASTPDADWTTLGSVAYDGSPDDARRHEYSFAAVQATGVRLITQSNGLQIAVDELEVYGSGTQGSGFLLELNSTGNSITLGGVELEAGRYARVAAAGSLSVGGLSVDGAFHFELGGDGLDAAVNGRTKLTVLDVTVFDFGVEGGLRINQNGLAGVIDLDLGLDDLDALGLDLASIDGGFRLEVNTSNQPQPFSQSTLPAGPYGRVTVDSDLSVLGQTLQGRFDFIQESDGLRVETYANLELKILDATLFQFSALGGLVLKKTGIAGVLDLNLLAQSPEAFGFSLLAGGEAGLTLVETNGAMRSGNAALEGVAFAKDVIFGSGTADHQIDHLNDGLYGNGQSWIGDAGASFAGIAFSKSERIKSVAFGRDNSGGFIDRSSGAYTIQYTTVPNPDSATPEDQWKTIGTLVYDGSPDMASRHEYAFDPVSATGIRIVTQSAALQVAIDELEVYRTETNQFAFRYEINSFEHSVEFDGAALEPGPYLRVAAQGTLSLDDFFIDGMFHFQAGQSGLDLEVNGTMSLKVLDQSLFGFEVEGGLRINASGVAGILGLDLELNQLDLFGAGLGTIEEAFRLEVNFTGLPQTFSQSTLPAGPYASVIYEGQLALLGLTLDGRFDFKASSEGVHVNTSSTLDLMVLDTILFRFSAQGGLSITGAGIAGLVDLEVLSSFTDPFGFGFQVAQSFLNEEAGLTLVETGGLMRAAENLALNGASFAKDVYAGGVEAAHQIAHLNDGQYGNAQSWIGASGNSFAGVAFTESKRIGGVAFGRDNNGSFTDRSAGTYVLQYTTVPNPNAATPEDQWITLDSVVYSGEPQFASRHEYSFAPVDATGLRVVTQSNGLEIAIDELEVYGGGEDAFGFRFELNTTNAEAAFSGVTLEAGVYARASASGELSIGGISIDGAFQFEAGSNGLHIDLDGTLALKVFERTIFEFNVVGGLEIDSNGLAGIIDLDLESEKLEVYGIQLAGADNSFRLEVNLSNVQRVIGQTTLPEGPYARVAFEGDMTLLGMTLAGSFDLTAELEETSSNIGDAARPDPGNGLVSFRNLGPGAELYFNVAGNASAGGIWGTDVYTDDSPLAAAAVHSGALAHGQSGVVKVTLLDGQSNYSGSSRNGVGSQNFGSWAGSYSIERFNVVSVLPDPGSSIPNYRSQGVGTVLYFKVTGDANAGQIWGTNVYTDDSRLAAAAVHAGVLKQGETGVVKVTLAAGQSNYASSSQNGVTSASFGAWQGSYSVEAAPAGIGTSQPVLRLEVDAGLELKVVNAPLFEFSVRGGVKLTPSGVAGALELNLDANLASDFNLVINPGQGVSLVETGGGMRAGNLALNGAAFAKDVYAAGVTGSHQIGHLNDGQYGNGRSWIGDSENSYAGVTLGGSQIIDRIAFGRDNTGIFKDRFAGSYVIQYTNVAQPGAATPDNAWIDVGVVTLQAGDPSGALRHEYQFSPVEATAVRIVAAVNGTCVDELEVYGADGLHASFRLEINTASIAHAINGIVLPPGPYAQVSMEGSFGFLGYSFNGLFKFRVAPDGLEMRADASFDLLGTSFRFSGAIGLYADGFAFRGVLGGSGVSNNLYTVRGNFEIQVNTTPRDGLLGLARQSVRLAVSNGEVSFAGVTLTGALTIDIASQSLNIDIPSNAPLTLRVLNSFEVKVSGHIRPGDVNLTGSVSASFGHGGFIHLGGTLTVNVSNSGVSGTAHLGLTVFNQYLGSTNANFSVTAASFKFSMNTAFQVLNFARFNGSLEITLDRNVASASLSGTLSLWNTVHVGVSGYVNSYGQYSFSGSTYLSIGNSNLGANFYFNASVSHNGFSLSVKGEAHAGVWILGGFYGLSGTLNGQVDSNGFIKTTLSIWVVWEWRFTFQMSLNNGIQVWLSEVGGSEVYFTSNLDGTRDGFHSAAQSGTDGAVDFTQPWEELEVDELEILFFQVLDKNGDGRLDSDVGQIKVVGGYHWLSGEENPGVTTVTDRWLYGTSDWAEAVVFIDLNGNDQRDEGELSIESDEVGDFDFWALIFGEEEDDFEFGLGLLEPFDANGDGAIDETEGVLVLFGGVDYFTGEPNTGIEVFEAVEPFFETDWVGAIVFLDVNGNLELDEFEIYVETDGFGFWDFDPFDDDDEFEEDPYWTLLDLIEYDLNEDGVIDSQEGQLIVRGGVNWLTDEPNSEAFILEEAAGYGFLDYAGAEVFFDSNLNGEHDEGEPSVRTDEEGYFEFYTLTEEDLAYLLQDLVDYDLNGDGVISSDEGILYMAGGWHWQTEEENDRTFQLDEALGYGETDYAGARVFLDLNGNAAFDEDEPSAITDSYGFYWFYIPSLEEAELWLGDLVQFDLDRNGFLTSDEGRLILQGGDNLFTGDANPQSIVIDDPYGFDFTDYSGATVFFDLNGNGVWDEGELKTTTDQDGYYEFVTYSDEELAFQLGRLLEFDLNKNGVLDPDEGQMVVVGGINKATGVANDGSVILGEVILSGYTLYSGAEAIYWDANKNLILEEGEVSATPDQDDYYSFFEFDPSQYGLNDLGNLARYDENHNGKLDPWEGIFVIEGGVDQNTGLENPLFVRALGSDFGSGLASTISPLSNLKVSMVNWWEVNPGEADRLIATVLGLPPHLQMNMLNPLGGPDDPLTERILGAGASVTTILMDMAAVLQAANPSLSPIQAQSAVADSLADAIIYKVIDRLEEVDSIDNLELDDDGYFIGIMDNLQLDINDLIINENGVVVGIKPMLILSDPDELAVILEDAAYWTDTDVDPEILEALAFVAAEKIERINFLAKTNLDQPLEAFAAIKALTQLETSTAFADLAQNGGSAAGLITLFTGESLVDRLRANSVANTAPLLSTVEDQQTLPGTVLKIPLRVWDINQAHGEMQISASSSNQHVVADANIRVLGEGEHRVIEIQVSEALVGETQVTISVNDGEFVTRESFSIAIKPHALKWESIAIHGAGVGEVGLEIGEDGSFSESRQSGIRILEVTFNVALDAASLQASSIRVAGIAGQTNQAIDLSGLGVALSLSEDGKTVRLLFSQPLADDARYRFELRGVKTAGGRVVEDGLERTATVLYGDVFNDLRVNNTDLGAMRALPQDAVVHGDSIHDARSDINLDGRVNSADAELHYGLRGRNAQFIAEPGEAVAILPSSASNNGGNPQLSLLSESGSTAKAAVFPMSLSSYEASLSSNHAGKYHGAPSMKPADSLKLYPSAAMASSNGMLRPAGGFYWQDASALPS